MMSLTELVAATLHHLSVKISLITDKSGLVEGVICDALASVGWMTGFDSK